MKRYLFFTFAVQMHFLLIFILVLKFYFKDSILRYNLYYILNRLIIITVLHIDCLLYITYEHCS